MAGRPMRLALPEPGHAQETQMPSKQFDELKVLYRSWTAALAAKPTMELEEMRRMFEHWGDVTAEPGGVDYEEVRAGGVHSMWATPGGVDREPVLLAIHGGGCSVCSIYSHRKLFGHIAK